MNIVVSVPGYRPDPWLKALREALPEATLLSADEAPPDSADFAVVWAPEAALFDRQTRLKAIFNLGAGVDALLRVPTLPQHLPVVRLGDAGMSVQMAEYVLQAVVRFARDLDRVEADLAQGQWTYQRTPSRLHCPVGVLGLGAIGERVARALAYFEYPTLGYSRSPKYIDGVECYAGDAGFDQFLRATRVLVCTLPLTDATRGILCQATFEKLQPDAYLINVGRGAHLVEEDLLAAIDSGRLKGATLDVFATEPLPAGHPFVGRPQIRMTPHISAVTLMQDSVRQIAGKIRRFVQGEPIEGIVERARGY